LVTHGEIIGAVAGGGRVRKLGAVVLDPNASAFDIALIGTIDIGNLDEVQ